MPAVPDVFEDAAPRPSTRDKADFLHLAHHLDSERYSYLANKLRGIGQRDLADLTLRWSREHATVARNLRKQAR